MTTTLKQIYKRFPTEMVCIKYLEAKVWPKGVICPHCGHNRCSAYPLEGRYKCNKCNRSFSVTVGTMFHKSKVDLRKWLYAIHLFMTELEPISARKLGEKLTITKDSALKMTNRLKKEYIQNRKFLELLINDENG